MHEERPGAGAGQRADWPSATRWWCGSTLRTDRDMEYVHLKDHRGSGTEPVNVLSRYKYQDGLGYYESTKDTASHFFIDYLPKGTYVFEYTVRVQLKGKYPTGFAEHPVHVRPGVQQPLGKHSALSQVGRVGSSAS